MVRMASALMVCLALLLCRTVDGQETDASEIAWATHTIFDPSDAQAAFQGTIDPILSAASRVDGFVYTPRYSSGEHRSPINIEVYLRPGESRIRTLLAPGLDPNRWTVVSWDTGARITTGLLLIADTISARSTRGGVSLPTAMSLLRAPESPDHDPVASVVRDDLSTAFTAHWSRAAAAIPPIAEQPMSQRVPPAWPRAALAGARAGGDIHWTPERSMERVVALFEQALGLAVTTDDPDPAWTATPGVLRGFGEPSRWQFLDSAIVRADDFVDWSKPVLGQSLQPWAFYQEQFKPGDKLCVYFTEYTVRRAARPGQRTLGNGGQTTVYFRLEFQDDSGSCTPANDLKEPLLVCPAP